MWKLKIDTHVRYRVSWHTKSSIIHYCRKGTAKNKVSNKAATFNIVKGYNTRELPNIGAHSVVLWTKWSLVFGSILQMFNEILNVFLSLF